MQVGDYSLGSLGFLGLGFFLFFLESAFVVFVHEADGLDVVALGNLVETHDVGWQHYLAQRAQVKNGVVCKEVGDNLVTGLQPHSTSHFAALSRICILLCIE